MKTLAMTIVLTLITSNPILAWDDFTDGWEEARQAEEENYRNRQRAILEDLHMEKAIEDNDRLRQYYEGNKTFPER